MARCKYCDKGGFFSFVSSDGLCKKCAPQIEKRVRRYAQIMEESWDIIEKSKSLKTKLGRYNTILQQCCHLQHYEDLDIKTINPSPDEIFKDTEKERDECLKDFIRNEMIKDVRKLSHKPDDKEIERENEMRFYWYSTLFGYKMNWRKEYLIEFLTANDENVCAECKELGKKKLSLKETEKIKPHWGCRCTIAIDIGID